LAQVYRFLSRNAWQKRLRRGELLINGAVIDRARKLRLGDQLHYYHPPAREPDIDTHLPLAWEGDGVMVVSKPAGLPMHENGIFRKKTFAEALKQQYGAEWAAVHRLDRETSGAVLCGATPKIRESLAVGLEHRKFRKEYLALCQGIPDWEFYRNESPIGDLRVSQIRIKKWVMPEGEGLSAATDLNVIGRGGKLSLVVARPITGRTNQIRIHLAALGLTILGDKLYHADENVFMEYYANGATEWVIEQAGFFRLCLHAWSLEFRHPETGKEVVATVPLAPEIYQRMLQESEDLVSALRTRLPSAMSPSLDKIDLSTPRILDVVNHLRESLPEWGNELRGI
jgi:23S rRNA pseudouridine1911/1915/1917 synthase